MPNISSFNLNDPKLKLIKCHNLVNISTFFIIKALSYGLQKEGILYSTVSGVKGANFVDVNIWLKYFSVAPYLLLIIVVLSFIFIFNKRLKQATIVILAYPVIYILVFLLATVTYRFVVVPNEYDYEMKYLKNNLEATRNAYNIAELEGYDFPDLEELSYDVMKKNESIKNKIRIVDYGATLDSNKQLQSLTAFYNFNDGDIINYDVNGEKTPVFISAREIDIMKVKDKVM